ncbi:unnamed protein product [Cuscuta epithymum]|uniref:Preprotein translocase subunit SecE n=1 Tax=Cuscuta epithymum TaxID=186058 RepID=A0AAV0CS96_9ASTE|nr:unnamed protein product [Cuscuta epithymum]
MAASIASCNFSISGPFQFKAGKDCLVLFHCSNRFKPREHPSVLVMPKNITTLKIENTLRASHDVKCSSYAPKSHDEQQCFGYLMNWFRAMKTVLSFLAEQPSQLKHIEWPSIQTTLKTASLALALVGLFIIALASVDSALCYVLALFSRRAT